MFLFFSSFVVNTYEEPRKEKESTGQPSDVERAERGRKPNQRSPYLLDHPKHFTHCRVVRSAGHNTHPNIVGPFFPNPNGESKRELYCTSMLALLRPWRLRMNWISCQVFSITTTTRIQRMYIGSTFSRLRATTRSTDTGVRERSIRIRNDGC